MEESTQITPMQRFWRLIKPDKKEVRNIYVYAIFLALVNLTLPVGIQSIINLIQGGQVSTSLVMLIIFVIAGVGLSGVLQIHQLQITEYLQQKIFARAAFEFAYRIPKIKLEAIYKHYAPELMNRFFDIVSVQKGLSKVLIDFSTATIQTVFGLILLSLYHPFFVVFSLVLILLIYSIFRFTSKIGLRTSLEESKNKYKAAHWLQELARTGITFKLAGVTKLHLERTNDIIDDYTESRDRHFTILKTQYILLVIFKVLVAAGLLIAGSLLVIDQQMNIGQFVAAEIIILMVLGAVEKLVLSLETIYDILTSLEKVGQVTDLELEEDEGLDIMKSINGHGLKVSLQNVCFTYPGQDKRIFNKVSINIKPGENVLIYGDSDSGKTTLLYLLSGVYKIESGSLTFNDLPVGNLNPNYLRSVIGDCLMDELLFEGTLYENITMGRPNATFENVRWAVNNLGLTDFVNELPKGLNTKIDPEGRQFSKGVVDKLLLARSIADKPRLLLIKDAFTAMVSAEREQILSFLSDKNNPWTMVVVSGDENWKRKVDRIFKAENASLSEIQNK